MLCGLVPQMNLLYRLTSLILPMTQPIAPKFSLPTLRPSHTSEHAWKIGYVNDVLEYQSSFLFACLALSLSKCIVLLLGKEGRSKLVCKLASKLIQSHTARRVISKTSSLNFVV